MSDSPQEPQLEDERSIAPETPPPPNPKAQETSEDDDLRFCREVLKFNPLSYQRGLLTDKHDRIAVRFCRQSGKTTTVAAKAVLTALRTPEVTVLIVAPGLRQSMLVMDKVQEHLRRMDEEYRKAAVSKIQRAVVYFKNGSKITALPCSENRIRGVTAHLILADETAFFQRDQYIFNNVLLPMLATTRGSLVISSTPWSTRSMFYEFTKGKLANRFQQYHATWEDAVREGLITKEFIEDMRQALLPHQFQMEFEAEFSENADVWLGQEILAKCVDPNVIYYGLEGEPRGQFYAGLDLGKHQDYSVLAVVAKYERTLRLVHLQRFPLGTSYASVIGYVKALNDRWRHLRAVHCDQTGVGEYIVEDIRNVGIPGVEGHTFTVTEKEGLATALKEQMRAGTLLFPYDRELINELNVERYELTKTGHLQFSHPEGTHDDRFWALALAVCGASKDAITPYRSRLG
jgi:phage FluMu gp28-like protein